jgi:hypothetical protein
MLQRYHNTSQALDIIYIIFINVEFLIFFIVKENNESENFMEFFWHVIYKISIYIWRWNVELVLVVQ